MALPLMNHIDLGAGSALLYCESLLEAEQAHDYLESLDKQLPWIRPTLRMFGKPCQQSRETCYVSDEGLPIFTYSGHQPIVNKWDDFPILSTIKDVVCNSLPGCKFNTVLVNRYASGNDYVSWHADDEKVYGTTPTIASVTLGAEREFLIRKKTSKRGVANLSNKRKSLLWKEAASVSVGMAARVVKCRKASYKIKECVVSEDVSCHDYKKADDEVLEKQEQYTFILKHGSLLVMEGNTQRDWEHSVPRRKKSNGLRISLTFRYVHP